MHPLLRIVLVDGSSGDVYWFKMMLKELARPVDLVVADGGPDTLEQIRGLQPDLVVSAWRLPFYNEGEFLAAARAIPTLQDVPIAVLSTLPQNDKAFGNLGVVRWIVKPIDGEQLEDLLSLVTKRRYGASRASD
jgi:CheY-like chemotaxis protein